MPFAIVTPATTYPVTLTEAKAQCRVDGTDEDTFINGLISTAADYVGQYLGRSIMAQTLRLDLDDFGDEMLLPFGPVSLVTSITYYDTAGAVQTLSTTVYQADIVSDPPRILRADGQTWPDVYARANAVSITYVTGYSAVPAAVKHACLLLIGDWYRGRENTSLGTSQPAEMPHAVTALLCNYRAYA